MQRLRLWASEPETLQNADLFGSWSGTASNGYSFTYTFEASGAFTWSLVGASGTALLGRGRFSTSGGTLILTGSFRAEEGDMYRTRLELSPYMGASAFCDSALTSDSHDGEIGTWRNVTTVQHLDDNDLPLGEPRTLVEILDLHPDGSVNETTTSGLSRRGRYTRDGDKVTTTFTFGNASSVRTYVLIDDTALCDPVYRLGR